MTGYRILNSLGRFIKVHKDPNHIFSNNKIFYKDCDASYIGQTKIQLKTRIKEHSSNIKLNSSKHSVISEHILQFSHTFIGIILKFLIPNKIFIRGQCRK